MGIVNVYNNHNVLYTTIRNDILTILKESIDPHIVNTIDTLMFKKTIWIGNITKYLDEYSEI